MRTKNFEVESDSTYITSDYQQTTNLPIQPDDSVEVKMIGRLVEHQQSRLHEQGPGVIGG